jgi:hypothetical protein
MGFAVAGKITGIEVIAVGSTIRQIARLRRLYEKAAGAR